MFNFLFTVFETSWKFYSYNLSPYIHIIFLLTMECEANHYCLVHHLTYYY